VTWIGRSLCRDPTASTRERLERSLALFEAEVENEADPGEPDARWRDRAKLLLNRAREQDDPEAAWRFFKAATRMWLYRDGSAQARLDAIRLLAEGQQKLTGWRKEAFSKILTDDGVVKQALTAHELAAAARLLHEHEDNEYHRLSLRRRQLCLLGFSAAALTCASVLLGIAQLFVRGPATDLPAMIAVPLLGALGAAVSGMLSVRDRPSGQRIPEQLMGGAVLIARLAVGAAMAIALAALWRSGFLNFGPREEKLFLIPLAFAAGFSEQLVQNALAKLGK
jgi:hypothetical protein